MSNEPAYNPYSAPERTAVGGTKRDGSVRAPGEALTWTFGANTALAFLVGVGVLVAGALGDASSVTSDLASTRAFLVLVKIPFALAWVYYAWTGVPYDARGDVSPGTAVGRLFIPFYNLKWMFDVNTRLCDTLEDYLAGHGATYPSPRSWAVYAAIGHFVAAFLTIVVTAAHASQFQFVVVGAGDLLWFTYAYRCDGLRRAVVREMRRDERWAPA